MTQRRSFLLKLISFFGVAAVATQTPKLFQSKIKLSGMIRDPRKVTYKIPDNVQANIRSFYKVDNFIALKKSYTDAGLLIDVSSFRFSDYTKTEMTFKDAAARKQFVKEYYGNISKYKNA